MTFRTIKTVLAPAVLSISLSAHAAVITVNSNVDSVANDGNCTLREAIEAANTNAAVDACNAGTGPDTIEFNLTGTTPADRTITLTNGEMTISDTLTIKGGVDGVTIDAKKKSRIFSASQPLTIENLTLTGGDSVGATLPGNGGAIYTSAKLTINNSSLLNNEAMGVRGQGGAIYIAGRSDSIISNSTLSGNRGKKAGGAIATENSAIVMSNSTLSGNTSQYGGAIATNALLTINNSTLSGNKAIPTGTTGVMAYGGAIFTLSRLTLNSSLLLENFVDTTLNNCGLSSGGHSGTVVAASKNNLLDVACGNIANGTNNNLVDSNYTLANTLEALADNGCVTKSGANSTAACVQTMALKSGSAAIDKGVANGTTADQRGFDYVGTPDIGAFEFGASRTLTIIPTPQGTVTTNLIDCGSKCKAIYGLNTTVKLTATANTGYTFDQWTGNCSGTNNPLSVKMDTNKTCAATFTRNSYAVTPSAGSNGSISPTTAQTVNHGDTTTFTVTPVAGYSANVGGTCGGTLSGNTYTTNAITAACTVEATFTQITVRSVPTLSPAWLLLMMSMLGVFGYRQRRRN